MKTCSSLGLDEVRRAINARTKRDANGRVARDYGGEQYLTRFATQGQVRHAIEAETGCDWVNDPRYTSDWLPARMRALGYHRVAGRAYDRQPHYDLDSTAPVSDEDVAAYADRFEEAENMDRIYNPDIDLNTASPAANRLVSPDSLTYRGRATLESLHARGLVTRKGGKYLMRPKADVLRRLGRSLSKPADWENPIIAFATSMTYNSTDGGPTCFAGAEVRAAISGRQLAALGERGVIHARGDDYCINRAHPEVLEAMGRIDLVGGSDLDLTRHVLSGATEDAIRCVEQYYTSAQRGDPADRAACTSNFETALVAAKKGRKISRLPFAEDTLLRPILLGDPEGWKWKYPHMAAVHEVVQQINETLGPDYHTPKKPRIAPDLVLDAALAMANEGAQGRPLAEFFGDQLAPAVRGPHSTFEHELALRAGIQPTGEIIPPALPAGDPAEIWAGIATNPTRQTALRLKIQTLPESLEALWRRYEALPAHERAFDADAAKVYEILTQEGSAETPAGERILL